MRHRRLFELGRADLSIGRLMEAHTDALAILHQANRVPCPGSLYAVWASERPGTGITACPEPGAIRLDGTKQFCTGIGLCDIALITVVGPPDPSRSILLQVDLRAGTAGRLGSTESWKSPRFESTNTGTIRCVAVRVDADDVIGQPGWYLDRPGFWHGAIGPAAVWAAAPAV